MCKQKIIDFPTPFFDFAFFSGLFWGVTGSFFPDLAKPHKKGVSCVSALLRKSHNLTIKHWGWLKMLQNEFPKLGLFSGAWRYQVLTTDPGKPNVCCSCFLPGNIWKQIKIPLQTGFVLGGVIYMGPNAIPRDPGSPKLRMVSWNLNTLRFGGDCTPQLSSDVRWARIPRVWEYGDDKPKS